MNWSTQQILEVLDACCDGFTFPMLDNGYVYLAATRLSLFRSSSNWALTIEVFGFSPRGGMPDNHIYTFASRLRNRRTPEDFVNREAYELYLASNPNNESRFLEPLEAGDWLDGEEVAVGATTVEFAAVSCHSLSVMSIKASASSWIAEGGSGCSNCADSSRAGTGRRFWPLRQSCELMFQRIWSWSSSSMTGITPPLWTRIAARVDPKRFSSWRGRW